MAIYLNILRYGFPTRLPRTLLSSSTKYYSIISIWDRKFAASLSCNFSSGESLLAGNSARQFKGRFNVSQFRSFSSSSSDLPGSSVNDKLDLGDLIVTYNAKKRVSDLRAKARSENIPNADKLYLRVFVESGGCSGFEYHFSIDDKPLTEEDISFGGSEAENVFPYVVVDSTSLDIIKGSTVDWEDSMMRSAFIISDNPNAESSCGCKSSFSLKE